ncbi:hypothetical protein [Brassicibacter mesophilus]|uniref:hypothetical protein n=1 Tax=Brassicibacter mesophilus TaxID=745119 RepID=UPI003D20DF23
MKKHLIFLLVFLLAFSTFATVFADEGMNDHHEKSFPRAISCGECGRGSMLMTDRVYLGQKTKSSDCYYNGCMIIEYYDEYREFYKCNYCGTREDVKTEEFVKSKHTLNH